MSYLQLCDINGALQLIKEPLHVFLAASQLLSSSYAEKNVECSLEQNGEGWLLSP